jgi:pimeloyl-ACP methyl ester carboxylesterase
VLGGSSPGGDAAIAPTAEMVAFLQRRAAMPIEEGVWASVPYNYGRQTRRERAQVIGEDIAVRLEDPYEPETYSAHLAAVLNHDATDGLGCIAAPTLVVHGDEDVLLDPGNARFIAEGIPGAALHLVPGGSHFYFTDDPSADGEIAKFLHAGEPV